MIFIGEIVIFFFIIIIVIVESVWLFKYCFIVKWYYKGRVDVFERKKNFDIKLDEVMYFF